LSYSSLQQHFSAKIQNFLSHHPSALQIVTSHGACRKHFFFFFFRDDGNPEVSKQKHDQAQKETVGDVKDSSRIDESMSLEQHLLLLRTSCTKNELEEEALGFPFSKP
jgi:hypothetical protein